MKPKRYIVVVFLLILFGLLLNRIRLWAAFEKVYDQRKDVSVYNELHTSGALQTLEKFVATHFDTIFQSYAEGVDTGPYEVIRPAPYKDRDHVRIVNNLNYKILRISFKNIKRSSSNLTLRKACDKLMEYHFYEVEITKDMSANFIEIYMENIYLVYKNIPNYHGIIFDKRDRKSYRFSENDHWYAFSVDNPEDAELFSHFFDFTPDWLRPYFEAQDFFNKWGYNTIQGTNPKRNPNLSHQACLSYTNKPCYPIAY